MLKPPLPPLSGGDVGVPLSGGDVGVILTGGDVGVILAEREKEILLSGGRERDPYHGGADEVNTSSLSLLPFVRGKSIVEYPLSCPHDKGGEMT